MAAGRYGGYGNMMDVWLPNTGIQMYCSFEFFS